jgi:hypothetical protein
VIVGIITWPYTDYQTSKRQDAERRELSQRLKKEIDHRRTERLRLLNYVKENAHKDTYEPRWIYKQSVIFLDGAKDPTLTNYHPVLEFKEKSWNILINDFEKATTGDPEVPRLRKEYEDLRKLWNETSNEGSNSGDATRTIEAVDKVFAIVNPKSV